MRVRRIAVEKLFGIFDHDIPLNQEERITIIHGPNGYGKTVMLQLLDALFSGAWSFLGSIPFEHFAVEFDNGTTLRCVQKAPSKKNQNPRRGKSSKQRFINVEWWRAGAHGPIESFMPSMAERDDSISHTAFQLLFTEPKIPDWLQSFLKAVSLRLIRTQRLETEAPSFEQPPISDTRVLTVQKYAEDLATEITTTLASYAERSQKLDSSFPNRLFEAPRSTLTIDEIRTKLVQLDERRARLTELGFLSPERDLHAPPKKIDESKIDVLSVYVQDTEEKLAVFDDLAQRIRLFMEIVNRRFKYKQLTMSKAQGFLLTSTVQKEPLPLTCLSSGEQHELILLFELLFKVKEHSLILIDEPEISLHLAWQQHFLSDLGQMVKLSNFDVLLATHSPAIIGKRWDLTVDLKGP